MGDYTDRSERVLDGFLMSILKSFFPEDESKSLAAVVRINKMEEAWTDRWEKAPGPIQKRIKTFAELFQTLLEKRKRKRLKMPFLRTTAFKITKQEHLLLQDLEKDIVVTPEIVSFFRCACVRRW